MTPRQNALARSWSVDVDTVTGFELHAVFPGLPRWTAERVSEEAVRRATTRGPCRHRWPKGPRTGEVLSITRVDEVDEVFERKRSACRHLTVPSGGRHDT